MASANSRLRVHLVTSDFDDGTGSKFWLYDRRNHRAAPLFSARPKLDGYALAANANGKYVVPYSASKPITATRYLVAYFATTNLSITTSVPGGNGAIREDTFESLTRIPYGANRQLLILPNPGCSIASLSAPNATSILTNADGKSKTVIYNNLQASQAVTASFAADAVVTANAGNDVTANGPGSSYAATLYGSATSNQGDITYAWSGTGLTFGSPTAAITTVYAAAAGDYVATLKVTSNGIEKTDTASVKVLDRTAYLEGVCTSCHNGSTPTIVADYDSSKHKTTPYAVVVCQTCHDPSNSGHYTVAQPKTVCQDCHGSGTQGTNFAKSSHATSTHYPGITCANCHNAHSSVANYSGCQTCHTPGKSYSIYSSNMVGKAPHYQTGTPDAGGYYATASYLATNGATCPDCHGHDNTINAGWAEGGHGSLTAAPWVSNSSHIWLDQGPSANGVNFQASPNQTNCIRCHTGATPPKKIDLTGDKTDYFNVSYEWLARGRFLEYGPTEWTRRQTNRKTWSAGWTRGWKRTCSGSGRPLSRAGSPGGFSPPDGPNCHRRGSSGLMCW